MLVLATIRRWIVRIAALLFIVIAPTLAGIGALVPLVMYGTREIPATAIPIAVAIGVVIALPAAIIIARRISKLTASKVRAV